MAWEINNPGQSVSALLAGRSITVNVVNPAAPIRWAFYRAHTSRATRIVRADAWSCRCSCRGKGGLVSILREMI